MSLTDPVSGIKDTQKISQTKTRKKPSFHQKTKKKHILLSSAFQGNNLALSYAME